MKKILCVVVSLLLLSACGIKVDDEALANLSQSLVKRWEYTDTLLKEVSKDELINAVQVELDTLQEFDIDDFKDITLYGALEIYESELSLVKSKMERMDFPSEEFEDEWTRHREKRAKVLHDIHQKHTLDIPDKYNENFNDVLSDAERLLKIEDVKKVLSKIKGLSDLDIDTEDNSIAISYPTESALSADSFVARKTGFPSYAMGILEVMLDYDFQNIVITTTNQDSIAITSYFTKESLNDFDFDKWDKTDSYDAYKFYEYTDAYHVRLGIWESLDAEIKQLIGDMNKQNSNEFWQEHGFMH